jgi:hypothetical protein
MHYSGAGDPPGFGSDGAFLPRVRRRCRFQVLGMQDGVLLFCSASTGRLGSSQGLVSFRIFCMPSQPDECSSMAHAASSPDDTDLSSPPLQVQAEPCADPGAHRSGGRLSRPHLGQVRFSLFTASSSAEPPTDLGVAPLLQVAVLDGAVGPQGLRVARYA